MIKVRCPNPSCKKVLAVKAELAGKKGKCPICGQPMTVPTPVDGAPKSKTIVAIGREEVASKSRERAAAKEAARKPAEPPEPQEEKPAPPAAEPARPKRRPVPVPAPVPTPAVEPPVQEEPAAKEPVPEQPQEEGAQSGVEPDKALVTPDEKVPQTPEREAPAESAEKEKAAEEGAEEPAREPEKTPAAGDVEQPVVSGAGQLGVSAAEQPVVSGVKQPAVVGAEQLAVARTPRIEVGGPPDAQRPKTEVMRRVAREPEGASYELTGNVLRVVGPMGFDLNPEFRSKCAELLGSGDKDLVLDLSHVLYLSSSHLGVLVDVLRRADDEKKSIVVRTSKKAARVLSLAGVDHLGRIEVVDID